MTVSSRITNDQRAEVLRELFDLGASGHAESESREDFRRRFCPIPEHARAFDPSVVLIVGERGSGKTELFRAVLQEGLFGALRRTVPSLMRSDRISGATWIPAYPVRAEFADPRGLNLFLSGPRDSVDVASEVWFAYLVRRCNEHLGTRDRKQLAELLAPRGGAIDAIYAAFQKRGNAALLALDSLDEELSKSDRYIFVGYDELDTLVGLKGALSGTALRGLIHFWATYSRRWSRIRPKIFLRTDMFRRNTQLLGADLPKLAANRAELTWSDRNLYTMLLKRFVNSGELVRQYALASKLSFEPDADFDFVPILRNAADAKPFIERLVGQYMGAGAKKGLAFNWILDHVRDGQGHALPRALVRLIEKAAYLESQDPQASGNRLLTPTSLRRAIDEVSSDQVRQALDYEWPWLTGVIESVGGKQVLLERRVVVRAFEANWSGNWGADKSAEPVRPPADDPEELVEYLSEIGLFKIRSDDRIDVPDLYLSGMKLKRKGGVSKGKTRRSRPLAGNQKRPQRGR